jgi:DNA-binding NarL/FixJ family response regulator
LISVLVVDDHELVRSGISALLADANGIEVVGQAESGEQAIKFAREHEPDVILMDIQMPGIGGMEATRKIARSDSDIRVIAVSACDDNPFAQRLLQAGASGYITKGADAEEMIDAIMKVHRGQMYISTEIAQRMALKPFQENSHNPFDDLSEREMQIALMIVNCQKPAAIGEKLFLSPKTVNSYRYRVFEKLGIDGDVELTRLAIRHGLIDANSGS